MSKALRHMTPTQRQAAIDRRMKVYDPKGPNGMGTLAAKAAYDKQFKSREGK